MYRTIRRRHYSWFLLLWSILLPISWVVSIIWASHRLEMSSKLDIYPRDVYRLVKEVEYKLDKALRLLEEK